MGRPVDLAGQRFGRLVAIEVVAQRASRGRQRLWRCDCDCGGEVLAESAELRNGDRKTCAGCSARRPLDLVGRRFGRWTVVRKVGKADRGAIVWECRCDCGAVGEVLAGNLTSGQSRSCGCLASDACRERFTTHGLSRSVEHRTWVSMRNRCADDKDPQYHRYGGRGIYVCPRWRADFISFYEDMGPRPSAKYSIDRKDNNGSYTCGKCEDCIARGAAANCRWATATEQSQNTRRNVKIAINGVTLCASEWARRHGISRQLLSLRLKKGWDPVEAATTPPTNPTAIGATNARRRWAGVETVAAVARASGIKTEALRYRMRKHNVSAEVAAAMTGLRPGRPPRERRV